MKNDPREVVLSCAQRIKEHDVAGLAELMNEGHLFVDSLGRGIRGREERSARLG